MTESATQFLTEIIENNQDLRKIICFDLMDWIGEDQLQKYLIKKGVKYPEDFEN